jgi:hypothetical protein
MSVTATSLPAVEPVADTARFRLRALADPSSLSRVLEQFALRNLVPVRVHCERREGGEELGIDVEVAGLGAQEADHLVRRFGSFPVVTGVLLQRD